MPIGRRETESEYFARMRKKRRKLMVKPVGKKKKGK